MDIESANQEACKRILEARPVWKDVKIAAEVIPGLNKNRIFYTGPSIDWENMCLPQKASITGAMIFEGLCTNMLEAEELIKKGDVELDINQNHNAIGPMSGPISASMAVCVVENTTFGNKAHAGTLVFSSQGQEYLLLQAFVLLHPWPVALKYSCGPIYR